MPYGRGGAGNILAAQQQQQQQTAQQDLEANKPPPPSTSDTTSAATAATTSSANQQHAFAGRGGAGNVYSPAELKKTGTFHSADTSHVFGDGTPAPDSSAKTNAASAATVTNGEGQQQEVVVKPQTASVEAPRKYGRGGAGNYYDAELRAKQAAAERDVEDGKRMEVVSAEVEKGVDESLAPPEKARLVG